MGGVHCTDRTRCRRFKFNTVCQWAWIINCSDSLMMVGTMVGNLFFSHISDWYGRRTASVTSMLLSFSASISMAAAPNIAAFVILRTLMAIGVGGGQIGPFTHAIEVVNPKMRAVVSFCDSFGYISGIILLPVAPWSYRKNWRRLQLMFSMLTVPALLTSFTTDESPRWLLATGRKERARPVIERLFRKNGMPHPEKDVNEIIDSTRVIEENTSKANIRHLFRSRTVAFMTISFFLQFLISYFVYFDMMIFVVNVGDNPWMNVLYTGLAEVPPLFLVTFLLRCCRRKVLYLSLYLSSGITAAALLFTREDQRTLNLIFACISKTGMDLLIPVLSVHVNESYITRERGIALGFGKMFTRLGASFAPIFKNMGSKFHASLNASACLLAILAAAPLKETFNKPLPEADDGNIESRSSVRHSNPGIEKNTKAVDEVVRRDP